MADFVWSGISAGGSGGMSAAEAPLIYTVSSVRTANTVARIFNTYAAAFAHAAAAGLTAVTIWTDEGGSPALSLADIPAASGMAIAIKGTPFTSITVSGTAPDASSYTWLEFDGPIVTQSADCYLGLDRTLVMRGGSLVSNGFRIRLNNVDAQIDGGVVLNNVNIYANNGEYLGVFAPDVVYSHRRTNAAHPMFGNIDYIECERLNGAISSVAASPLVTFEPTGSLSALAGGTCRDDRVGTFKVFSGLTGGSFTSRGFIFIPNSSTNTLHDATTETSPSGTLTLPLSGANALGLTYNVPTVAEVTAKNGATLADTTGEILPGLQITGTANGQLYGAAVAASSYVMGKVSPRSVPGTGGQNMFCGVALEGANGKLVTWYMIDTNVNRTFFTTWTSYTGGEVGVFFLNSSNTVWDHPTAMMLYVSGNNIVGAWTWDKDPENGEFYDVFTGTNYYSGHLNSDIDYGVAITASAAGNVPRSNVKHLSTDLFQ